MRFSFSTTFLMLSYHPSSHLLFAQGPFRLYKVLSASFKSKCKVNYVIPAGNEPSEDCF